MLRKGWICWWAYVLAYGCHGLHAQSPGEHSFQHLSIEQGLSHQHVNCLVQDDQGFIWIGTAKGLNRFDGHRTVVWETPGASINLKNESIHCAYKDRQGKIWMGGIGVYCLDPPRNAVQVFRHDKNNPHSIRNHDVTAFAEDERGGFWVGTRQGLYAMDRQTQHFTPFIHDTIGDRIPDYHRNRVIDIIPDRRGHLWVGTLEGIYRFSLSDHRFKRYVYDPEHLDPTAGQHILGMVMDTAGGLWFGDRDRGVMRMDTATGQFTVMHDGGAAALEGLNRVEKLFCDKRGQIWAASNSTGLWKYIANGNAWQLYHHDLFEPRSLASNALTCMMEDQRGMLWVGTKNAGVDRISPRPDKFKRFVIQPGKPGGICTADITAVAEDTDGNLWVGSNQGLMFLDRLTGAATCFQNIPGQPSLVNNEVLCTAVDGQGRVWVGTMKGLSRYDPRRRQWKTFRADPQNPRALVGERVFHVLIRKNGEIILGTNSGLARWREESEDFDNKYNDPQFSELLWEYYTCLYEDQDGEIWASTSRSGLYKFAPDFKIQQDYIRRKGTFNANSAHGFAEDPFGNVWVAADNGLLYWEKNTGHFTVPCGEQLLAGAEVAAILLHEDKFLWLSTNQGIARLELGEAAEIRRAIFFKPSDGLQGLVFSANASLKLRNGDFFMGGLKGFNLFTPSTMQLNETPPSMAFAQIQWGDSVLPITPELLRNGLEMNHDQSDFTLHLAALDFDLPENQQFKWQLAGFDPKMVLAGTQHVATYTQVPPGEYLFHAYASNNDGQWNNEGIHLKIRVIPPFWQTFPFYLLLGIGIAGLLGFLYWRRMRKVRKENLQQQDLNRKIAEARMTALRAQMNPHFIFNSLNTIQHFISESEKENALRYLSKFSRLIRIVLRNASQNTISIAQEVSMLEYYLQLEALRFSDKFEYRIDISKEINAEGTQIPSMLLQPYVENAVIHGLLNKPDKGLLQISITETADGILCRIEDNGIGRVAAAEIKNRKHVKDDSMGMQVTEERIRMLEAISGRQAKVQIEDLFDASGKSAGTRVSIFITLMEPLT